MRVHEEGPRARAVLELVRPHVDEILLAVDEHAPPEVAEQAGQAADRVLVVPHVHPLERPNAFMFAQCRGDWILRLDGDELPAAGLLAALRDLVAAPDVTRYVLPRVWLWPDAEHHLDERPWRPDHQPRLLRNDPATLVHASDTHTCETSVGPGRYLEHPLFHFDLLTPLSRRAEKVGLYDALRPGLTLLDEPMNALLYLPEERRPEPRVVPVGDGDREAIARVLAATARAARRRPPLTRVSVDAIDAHWSRAPWRDEDHAARIELAESDLRFVAASPRELVVAVENLGTATWPSHDDPAPPLRLSYRWTPRGASEPGPDGIRTALPSRQAPGERQVVPMAIQPPSDPGAYELALDLLVEHVRWFGATLSVAVDVAPAAQALLTGSVGGVRTAGRTP